MAEDIQGNIAHLIDGLRVADKTMKEQNLIDAGVPQGFTRLGPESINLADIQDLNKTDDIPDQESENRKVAEVVKELKDKQ